MVASVLPDTEKDSSKESKHSKYNRSPKGKLRAIAYNNTEKGRYRMLRAKLRGRINQRKLRIAQLEEELNEQKITD